MKIPVKQYWRLLSTYLRYEKSKLVFLTCLLLTGIALQLWNPQVIRHFIDTVQKPGTPLGELIGIAFLFIAAALLYQLTNVTAVYLGEQVGWAATNELRGDLAEHCLQLDPSFHKERTSGEMIQRIDGDVNELSNFFSNFVFVLFANLILIAGVLVMLFLEDWRLGAGMSVFVVVSIIVLQRVRAHFSPLWIKRSVVYAQFYGFIGEHLAGTEDTRANGAVGFVMRGFHQLLRKLFPISFNANMGSYTMWVSTIFIFTLGRSLALLYCGYLWSTNSMSLGTIYLVFTYTELLNHPLEQIRTQIQDLQRADASITRVSELFATRSKLLESDTALELPKGALSVSFADVSFAYAGEDEGTVLHNVDFTLQPGHVLGLLGRTGSGKSTLARLLIRFYDVGTGAIQLGGTDVRNVPLTDLRQRIGMVSQNIQLFQASVRDNLTLYDRSIPDDKLYEVLAELGLSHWVESLGEGLDTQLASGGGGLSSGEAQLLAFARVFLADPGLIILDEASSRLDPATEMLIERAIDKLLAGRTAIIIAHRLATIKRADDILILDAGHAVEFGPQAKLAADPGSRLSQLLQIGVGEVLV
ncbi:ABC transporter ATP-binding protein [Paenibacillus eucommiae]|uniref:ATP-binding cassette subfamily B protein n=1 Tax=Paenibacillus eucommiae TaxID=1355755 RepID=A0ABS4IQJ5_9BACL|nr:ABC transporter ATP-binding protein [Paenibacillus eucommiae]MBP1989850.1 ATP-binding cassette subfamily B protein [Paenibacillus eucommiae]